MITFLEVPEARQKSHGDGVWAAVNYHQKYKPYKQSRINSTVYGNGVVTIQLGQLSLVEWDPQAVNGSDSLETV